MAHIGALLCGHNRTEGIAKTALDQLTKSIEVFSARSVKYLREPVSDDALIFGPFSARVLLENGCAALVGRIDSFRMLYLSEFQSQKEYELGRRARSAFSFTGDVLPAEKTTSSLWSTEHEPTKLNRALFSQLLDHVYWKPAVEKMLDFVSTCPPSEGLSEILAIDPSKYIESTRGVSAQLYSTLSKGVHWEFFTSAIILDENTIKTTIRDTCLLISHLGLTSHFIPTAYASLTPSEAVTAYIEFRKDVP